MATLWGSLMTAIQAGTATFRREYLGRGVPGDAAPNSWEARRLREQLGWAYYGNQAYDDIVAFAGTYKQAYGLYRYTRSIYNPATRLANFWQTHLMGGSLDPLAGDGERVQSALPIADADDRARAGIAAVWAASDWQSEKQVWTLGGAIAGFAPLWVEDDPASRAVRLVPMPAGTIKWLEKDGSGRISRVVIEEKRPDPTRPAELPIRPGVVPPPMLATYCLVAERVPGGCRFRTYRDGVLFAWNGEKADWAEPYPFVPLAIAHHNDVGQDWGWPEAHPSLAKFREVDDQASKLGDQTRKAVEPRWLFSGVTDPNGSAFRGGAKPRREDPTPARPQPGREEVVHLYAEDPQAKPHPLVAPLDIPGALAHIAGLVEQIEADFPELRFERLRMAGEASGKAYKRIREPAEAKVRERRAGYDAALVRAHRMALAIGGGRGYPGFEGLGYGDWEGPATAHRVEAERPVFSADTADRLEEEGLFWQNFEVARRAGCPARVFLLRNGWTEDQVEDFEGLAADDERAAVEAIRARSSAAMADAAAAADPGAEPERTPEVAP